MEPALSRGQPPRRIGQHWHSPWARAQLVQLSKTRADGLAYASMAAGLQAAGELFKLTSNTNVLNIPYQGSAAAMNTLLAGDLSLMIATPDVVNFHAIDQP